jgi:hypothetical protein
MVLRRLILIFLLLVTGRPLVGCGPGVDLIHLRNQNPSQNAGNPQATPNPILYDQAVLADSPTAYWRLDEVSGATALEQVSNQNGTYTGTVTPNLEVSPFGNPAPKFSDTGSGGGWVELPPYLVENARTHEAWIKTSALNPGGVILGYQGGPVNGSPIGWSLPLYLTISSAYLAGEVYFGDSNTPPMASTALNDDHWHQVVLVVEATKQLLYVDGLNVANGDGSVTPNIPMHDNQIGTGQSSYWGNTPGGWYPFQGSISNVALYPAPLTAAQISAHYQAAGSR